MLFFLFGNSFWFHYGVTLCRTFLIVHLIFSSLFIKYIISFLSFLLFIINLNYQTKTCRMKKYKLLLAILTITCTTIAQTNYNFPVQAKIENGLIEGNYNTKDGLQEYFGVPFARPP